MADAQSAETLRRLLAEPGHSDTEYAMWQKALGELGGGDQTASAIRRMQATQAKEVEIGKVKGEARQLANPFAMPEGVPINESEQGVGLGERLLLKNLAANPDNAVRWLRGKGYEAYVYQPGQGGTEPTTGVLPDMKMRIAVKKPEWDHFKVVDPAGFDAQDLSDLFGDLVFGGATQALVGLGMAGGALAGAPGGPAGAAAGGAAGGMFLGGVGGRGMEAARQLAGRGISAVFGQPPLNPELSEPDLAAAQQSGTMMGPFGEAVGAAGKAVGGVIKSAAQGMANLATEAVGRLARVSPEQMAQALLNREIVLRPLGEHGSPYSAGELAQRTMQFLSNLDKPEFETLEHKQAQALLTQGSGQVRVAPILEDIRREITSPFKTTTTKVPPILGPTGAVVAGGKTVTTKVAQQAGKFGAESAHNDAVRSALATEAGNIARNAGATDVEDAIRRDLTMPVEMANGLKQQFDKTANYAMTPLEKDAAKETAYSFLGGGMRRGIKDTLPTGAVQDEYERLMGLAGKKLGVAKEFRDIMLKPSAEDIQNEGGDPEIVQGVNRAEQFFRTLLNPGARDEQKRLVRTFGRMWAPELSMAGLEDFDSRARVASTLSAFHAVESGALTHSAGRISYSMPGLSFGGKPLGASLGAAVGVTAGYLMGGPTGAAEGGAMGALAGGFAATPRGSIQTARALQAVGQRAGQALAFPATAAASAGGKPAAIAAGRTAQSAFAASAQATTAEQRNANVDAETVAGLQKVAGEVRKMAQQSGGALTPEQLADEFTTRAQKYLEQRKLVLASP
jgi:hypothetical protein